METDGYSIFLEGISPNVNIIVQLEYKLTQLRYERSIC